MADDIRIPIASDEDMVPARAHARTLALELGFSHTDATLIATAVSEIARNIIVHVGKGEITMKPAYDGRRQGLVIVADDKGPGMRDPLATLERGVSSRGGLGLGLPGARRLMDDFDVRSERGRGTTVTMTKWRVRDELELLRERRRLGGAQDGDSSGGVRG